MMRQSESPLVYAWDLIYALHTLVGCPSLLSTSRCPPSSLHAPDTAARHHALNDVLVRAFSVAKEPVSLFRIDGKRPDGMTLIPWRAGKPVVWDVTVVSAHVLILTLRVWLARQALQWS